MTARRTLAMRPAPKPIRRAEPTWTCENDPDPERWFPIGAAAQEAAIADLKPICQACPAVEACLKAALSRPSREDHGIWAGTTKDERDAIRRRQAKAAARAAARERAKEPATA